MDVMLMDDAQKKFYLDNHVGEPLERLQRTLKKYEYMTGEVNYQDYFLNKEISVKAQLENGRIRSVKATFDNGSTAKEFFSVRNSQVVDSALRFYPDGMLFSRRVYTVDSTRRLYDEFHPNGTLRSRNINNSLYTWFENGVLSGTYIFNGEQVGERRLWHRNGKIKEISFWVNDTMNGHYREWDSTGHVLRDMVFVMGK